MESASGSFPSVSQRESMAGSCANDGDLDVTNPDVTYISESKLTNSPFHFRSSRHHQHRGNTSVIMPSQPVLKKTAVKIGSKQFDGVSFIYHCKV